MFDSNMFDEFLDGNIDVSLLTNAEITVYVTPIQKEELSNASGSRGEELLEVFETLSDESIPSILAYDVEGAGYDQGGYAGIETMEIINAIREAHSPGEYKDANIATAAVQDDLILITADSRLQNAMEETYPDCYITKDEFVEIVT